MSRIRLTKSWSSQGLQFFAKLQEAVAKISYPEDDRLIHVKKICGVDVAYTKDRCAAAAVVQNISKGENIETVVKVFTGRRTPYIPGFLFLREGPPLLEVLTTVQTAFDLLLVDGHGRAHPRRCGLATLLGFVAGFPTVGIAKSLLVGELVPAGEFYEIVDRGEVVGLCTGRNYFSQGYGVSFNDLRKVAKLLDGKYPEPLRQADRLSRNAVKKSG
ncbi:MAG: endonuclease V [Candidatus Caldarchaeum sp.]